MLRIDVKKSRYGRYSKVNLNSRRESRQRIFRRII
jgi:hypothetical protein